MQKPRRHSRFITLLSAPFCLLFLAILTHSQITAWNDPLDAEDVSRGVERTLWIHSILPSANTFYGKPLHWLWMPDDGSGITRTLINAFEAVEHFHGDRQLEARAALTALYRGREDVARKLFPVYQYEDPHSFSKLAQGIIHLHTSDPEVRADLARNHAVTITRAYHQSHAHGASYKPGFWDYQAIVIALGELPPDLLEIYQHERTKSRNRLIFVSFLHLAPLFIGLLLLSNFTRWLRNTPVQTFTKTAEFQPTALLALFSIGMLLGQFLSGWIPFLSNELYRSVLLISTLTVILVARRFVFKIPISFMPVHGLEHPRKILRVRQIFPSLLLCLLPGYILLEILPSIPLLDVMPYVPDGTSQSLVAQRFMMAAGLAAYVVIIPILSEILYRGILHRNLCDHMPRLPAILISSLVFAITIMLWTPAALVFAFSSGIVFAILYEKTNSLWPAIVIHAIIGFTFSAQTWLVYGP